MRKRIICILMMLIFVSQGCFAQDVFFGKAETQEYIPISGSLFENAEGIACEEDELYISFFNNLSFEEYILQAVTECEEFPEEITGLSQYELKAEDFLKLYRDVAMRHPEAFITPSCTYYYNNSGIVVKVEPVYVIENKAEVASAILQMNEAIKEYTDLAAKYDTKLEKLLVIHDKMVADCDYDVSVLSDDPNVVASADKTVYHAYGALCNQKAVCQGYSQALYMIGKKLGIEMDFCRSDEKRHMWNYVKLDDKWYHMDMTNDDPLENGAAREDSRAWHGYFMVSNDGLNKDAHGTNFGTLTGEKYTCGDKRYESDHLFNLGFLFTAEREADGYFHVRNSTNVPAFDIGDVTIDYKSKSLYTGAVVTAPCVAYGKYNPNDSGTNLYLFQRATKDVPSLVPVVKGPVQISMLGAQESFEKNEGYVRIIRPNIDKSSFNLLTIFLWEKDTLIPYSTKTEWNREE